MALKTSDEYLDGVTRLGHRVFVHGEKVADVVHHPVSRPAVLAMAETYRGAAESTTKALFTSTSHLTGEPINRFTHIHQDTGDLVKKILMLREMGRRTASCFQRCAGLDCLNTLYGVTFEIDRKHATGYHARFVRFLRHIQEHDLVPAACMTDPKGDRSLSPSAQRGRDQYLRIVERRRDGLVVRGAKLHITGAINSHELLVVPTRALGEDERDFAVAFAVPSTATGITFVHGRQPSDTRRLEAGQADAGNAYFGGSEALVVFDDVFVPEERVFMCGERDMAGRLVECFAAHHRVSYGGCKVGVGDVLIGATAALAEAQGIDRATHVRDKLAEMIHLNETMHGVALASALKGTPNVAGAYEVDPLLANVCKLNVTRFPFEIARLAQDIAGGLLVTMPSLADRQHPEVGEYVKKYFAGKGDETGDLRVRLVRLIENITLGPGAASYLTESIHGAGSPQAQKIMIGRLADLDSCKACALRLCGGTS